MLVNDINQYRKAKVIVKDLSKALTVINTSLASLEAYRKYTPVGDCLRELKENKMLIKVYIEKFQLLIDSKGLVEKS